MFGAVTYGNPQRAEPVDEMARQASAIMLRSWFCGVRIKAWKTVGLVAAVLALPSLLIPDAGPGLAIACVATLLLSGGIYGFGRLEQAACMRDFVAIVESMKQRGWGPVFIDQRIPMRGLRFAPLTGDAELEWLTREVLSGKPLPGRRI